ncbi:MAG: hypothetical protein FWD13_03400 [Treponema sp.]|nr:hypothetical protein [Treponema sp.]
MNKRGKFLAFVAFAAIIVLFLTGCASVFHAVNVRVDDRNNLTTVRPGGTLQLRASGRDIVWTVSSTSDGSGRVDSGTYVANGMLIVAPTETSLVLHVTATSSRDGFSSVLQVRVVTVTGITVTPADLVVVIGRTLQFRSQVNGTNHPDQIVNWSVSSNENNTGAVTPGTSINANGLLTVAANESSPILYVTSTSVVDSEKSSTVPITVAVPTISHITVNSDSQSVRAGETLQFRSVVTGNYEPDTAVTWRVGTNAFGSGAVTPGTSIDANGLLTIANNESLSNLFVVATSVMDPTKSASVSVSVIIPIITNITISPVNHIAEAGTIVQMNATVWGVNNPSTAITWRVSSNAAGTGAVAPGTNINTNGQLSISAAETSRVLYVFATSVFDPTKMESVIVIVIPDSEL